MATFGAAQAVKHISEAKVGGLTAHVSGNSSTFMRDALAVVGGATVAHHAGKGATPAQGPASGPG